MKKLEIEIGNNSLRELNSKLNFINWNCREKIQSVKLKMRKIIHLILRGKIYKTKTLNNKVKEILQIK